ncbi:MAG: adenylate/guanylate cyclase domain-containing protein, partial [Desulfobacterales bacterium]
MSETTLSQSKSPIVLPPDCQTVTLGVAFFDLSRMAKWTNTNEDALVASFLQKLYQLAADGLEPAGGRIVKFIGDAGLVVCPEESVETLIFALCDLSGAARRCGREFGIDTHLNISMHVGPVIAGSFGPKGDERFDVIGKTVNIAARLGRQGVTLSTQA